MSDVMKPQSGIGAGVSDLPSPAQPAARKLRWRRWAVVVIVIAAVAAAAMAFWSRLAPVSGIAASGTIEAIESDVAPKVQGRLIELRVHDGDRVVKGELLARLEQTDATLSVDQARANVAAAAAQVAVAQAAYALQGRTYATTMTAARSDVGIAGARVGQADDNLTIETRTTALGVAQAEAQVAAAQATYSHAQVDVQRARSLVATGDAPRQQLDDATAADATAAAQLAAARDAVAVAQAEQAGVHVRRLDVQSSNLQRHQSLAALSSAQAQADLVEQRRAQVLAAEAALAQTRATLGLAQDQRNETDLRAPFDGFVVSHNFEVGELVQPGSAVMTVGDLTHPYLYVYVSESDLPHVKTGAHAGVTVDGLPGRTFPGVVTEISTSAEFTPENVQTKDQRIEYLVFRVNSSSPTRRDRSNRACRPMPSSAPEVAAAAIEIANVTRRFGKTVAVDRLSLRIECGEIFALVGPDGAGKTTLLRLICGALAVDSGTLSVDGVDVVRQSERVQAAIGYMPQRFSLYPDLSVIENLHFYGEIFGVSRADFAERSQRFLADFALAAFADRRAEDLSGGMKQKLALACTLIHSPATILLDEPTAGVDPLSRREFWRILYGINRSGTTIVVSTPYMDEAERANRVAFISRGTILECGTPADLKRNVHGEVVEVTCARRGDARRALHGDPLVRSVEIFGETLHVLVASAEQALPDVRGRLAAAGIEDPALRAIPASLEDAFVARLTA